jgi:hypothetical protein
MICSREDPAPSTNDLYDDSKIIIITPCCLCSFPFPQNDIILSSCRHLYHPFCASILFVNNSKYLSKYCGEFCHPDWHRSFECLHLQNSTPFFTVCISLLYQNVAYMSKEKLFTRPALSMDKLCTIVSEIV